MAAAPPSPEISLIITAWKPDPDQFRVAVRSALDQEGVDHEVVVVDDGSPEPVAPLLEGIDDPRLRTVRIAHGGAAAARNAGTDAARGRFARFLDQDDATPPHGTAALRRLAGEHGPIAYGATAFCDADLRPVWVMRSRLEGSVAEACLESRFTVRPHALLFPMSVVDATGPWNAEAGVSEDWDFVLRALEVAPVCATDEIVTLYRKHGASITGGSQAQRGYDEAMALIDRYLDRNPQSRGSALERRARAAVGATRVRAALTRREPRQALGYLRGASVRALVREGVRSLPAARGHLRRRLDGAS